MSIAPYELDVRPILRAGGEPFAAIMDAVNELKPGQPLRLLATFQPVPLFRVLAKKGFDYAAQELPGGDWEVLFTPGAAAQSDSEESKTAPKAAGGAAASAWPAPLRHLDNRDLSPPEPMVRTLAAVEEMKPGEVLCALMCQEPVFLLPELASRGHEWQGAFEPDGSTYKVLIRVGAGKGAAA